MLERETSALAILPVMIGTAGHVDHGKTELVKLLTGCDTDLLPQEKQRGMTIDLGFAPFLLGGARMAGIIDVPGHEDFIRNMIAGATSIDVLLLVVAADDGIKPQTVEHMRIACLLRTPRIMAVITKSDLVTPERQQQVKESVTAFLSHYGFPQAPVLTESNTTGEGINEVRNAICHLVESISRPPGDRAFRMNVERVFSIRGYGTVVTGIPLSGECAVQDELELWPGQQRVVCRAIQEYGYSSQRAQAHACSAINIRGVKLAVIERGMTLARPGAYRDTTSAILSVRMVHETLSIRRRQQIRFCCGTSNRVVSCVLGGARDTLNPEEEGFAQIKLSNPMVLAAGDRFVLRSLSPSATVAGGIVLTANADSRKHKMRRDTGRLEMARVAAESGDVFLSEILAGSTPILHRSGLAPLVQSDVPLVVRKATGDKTRLGTIIPIGSGQWVISSRMAEFEELLRIALSEYHRHNRCSRGMSIPQAGGLLGLNSDCIEGLKEILAHSRTITVHEHCLALKEFRIELTAEQQDGRGRILDRVVEAGRHPVAASHLASELGIVGQDLQFLLRVLSEEGVITMIQRYIVHTPVVEECLQQLLALFEEAQTVELNRFREIAGLSRNVAVPMFEYFDSKGITCRHENGRRLMPNTQ